MKFYAKASLLALALSSPIWADPRLQVQVDSGGQHIDVKLSHAAVLQGVTQRWLQNPRRFEITIPKAEWQGKSLTPVDRGIVQKVQVQQGTGSVVIQIHSLGTPKMSWLGTPGQKAWTLRVSPTDMVASGQVPSLPGTSVASRPPVAQPKPPVAQPKPPVAQPKPPEAQPKPPVAQPKPPVEQPKPPVAQPKPPVEQPKPAQRPEQRLITVNIVNQDLPSAIRQMAKAANMQAEVGPGVEGAVTVSFTEVPLARALTSVLGKQAKFYEYKIDGDRLQVFGDSSAGGTTLVTSPPVNPANLTSDYFTLQPDKPVGEMLDAVRRVAGAVELFPDERLNVLFVRGDEAEVEKVRNLLRNILVK